MTAHPAPAPLRPLARRIARERAMVPFQRDPEFVRRHRWLNHRFTGYFSPEVRGVEHVPRHGPVLVVGNHSATFFMPDAWVTTDAVVERRGVEAATYVLAYDLLFAIPGVGSMLRRAGAVPAAGTEASAALEAGAAVVVFPGGDHDACRPWTDRDRVDFGSHRGFVRLALRAGVPVVPAVAYGAHHAVVVVARGEPVARALHLSALRVNVLPFLLGPPFGLTPVVGVPLPAQVTVEFLPALDWTDRPAAAAEDPATVEACYGEIVAAMQSAMDRLHAQHPHPVADGAASLARSLAREISRVPPRRRAGGRRSPRAG